MSEQEKPKVKKKKGTPEPQEVNWRAWGLGGVLFFLAIPLGLYLWNPFTGVQSVKRRVAALEGRAELEVVAPGVLQALLGSDEGLWSKVAGGTQIMRLHLENTKVSDQDMWLLRSTPFLKSLHLANTAVTDEGLNYLKYATELEDLELSNTQVTEKGLADISRLPKLRSLILDETQVTKGIVDVLKTATSIKTVNLTKTKISPEELVEIRKSLPGVEIQPKEGEIAPGVPAPANPPPPAQPAM